MARTRMVAFGCVGSEARMGRLVIRRLKRGIIRGMPQWECLGHDPGEFTAFQGACATVAPWRVGLGIGYMSS